MGLLLTDHARVRTQQRAFPRQVVDLLMTYGAKEPAGRGCWSYFFTRRTVERVMRERGAVAARLSADYRHAYMIVAADEVVVTVAYRR